MTITNDSLNLLYGYGTLTYYGLMDYEYSVSISYMGMEPEYRLKNVNGKLSQSPIWVWNEWDVEVKFYEANESSLNLLYGYGTQKKDRQSVLLMQLVSISYMGMEQQHLVDIKIITSKYGDVKKKEG